MCLAGEFTGDGRWISVYIGFYLPPQPLGTASRSRRRHPTRVSGGKTGGGAAARQYEPACDSGAAVSVTYIILPESRNGGDPEGSATTLFLCVYVFVIFFFSSSSTARVRN